jgi:hypothetical protein
MDSADKSGLESAWEELGRAFGGALSWKWDGRFEAVLAEFAAGKKESIRGILERSLRITWDSSNIDKAPDIVREVNSHLGGLRAGQMLFTTDPNREPLIFCAWWPWENGKTISLRIASADRKLSDPEKAEKIQLLKQGFGI